MLGSVLLPGRPASGGTLDLGGFRMALAVAAGLLALEGAVGLAVSGAIVRSSVAGVSRALC